MQINDTPGGPWKKKSKVLILSLTLAMALTSCSTQIVSTTSREKISNTAKTDIAPTDLIENNSSVQLSGTVHFPEVNLKNRGFDLKAVSEDVRSGATVSLLYPPDFPVEEPCFSICASTRGSGGFTPGPNVTIATGLTSNNSSFKIKIDKDKFTPDNETIYVLEAEKRLGGSGNYIVTLRTFVRWTGTKWESITKSKIDLDLSSTALTIISSWEPEELPPEDTIGMISTSGGVARVDYGNLPVNRNKVEEVIDLENQAIAQNQDPFAAIFYQALGPSGEYNLKETVQITGDVLVNTGTDSTQREPAVAKNAEGDYVIAWGDSYDSKIHAQRYNKAGRQIGEEIVVNPAAEFNTQNPAVAMAGDGGFVVTWSSQEVEPGLDIFARRFEADGVPFADQFMVNTYTTGYQLNPAIAMENNGDFVITWESGLGEELNQDGNKSGIYAKRYNSDGTSPATNGAEFQVNTYTTSAQQLSSVAMDSDGDFVITWMSGDQDGYLDGVFAQRYNTSGNPQPCSALSPQCNVETGEFQVNTYTSGHEVFPAVAMDNAGDFVITWDVEKLAGFSGISAQIFNKSGVPQGSEFQVSEPDINYNKPDVAMDFDGDFVVTWNKYESFIYADTFARRYNRSGSAQDSQFKVNQYTGFKQQHPAIAMDSAGDFVITWDGEGAGDSYGIFSHRFNAYAISQEFSQGEVIPP